MLPIPEVFRRILNTNRQNPYEDYAQGFLGHIIRNEVLEELLLPTGYIEGKRNRCKETKNLTSFMKLIDKYL